MVYREENCAVARDQRDYLGPIVPILSWLTEEEVLTLVNNTLSGLDGSVWLGDPECALRIAHRIEAGTIWINSFEKPLLQGYFAGHKESGVGGEWGVRGLYSYCKVQVIHYYKADVAKMATYNGTIHATNNDKDIYFRWQEFSQGKPNKPL